jgi:hypothetical protein
MVLMVKAAPFEGTNKPIKQDRKKGKETLKGFDSFGSFKAYDHIIFW